MLIYFLLIGVVCVDFLLEYVFKKYANLNENKFAKVLNFIFKYRCLTVFALVCISTFKAFSVGYDTQVYVNYFEALKTGKRKPFVSYLSSEHEYGFTFLCSLLAVCGFNFRFLLFLVSLFVSIALVVSIKKLSPNNLMSLILYIALGVFAQSLSALRQIIAIAFAMLALIYIKDKKWWQPLLLIALATLFHSSAIVCIVLIPIRYIKLNYWWVLGTLVLTIICSFCLPFILKVLEKYTFIDYYSKYFVNFTGYIQETDVVNILYTVGIMVVYVILYLGRSKVLRLGEKKELYDYLLLINLFVPLIRICGFIANIQALFNRVSMYFFISYLFIIPMFVESVRYDKKLYIACSIMVYIIASGYMFYLYAVKLSCGVVPYVL